MNLFVAESVKHHDQTKVFPVKEDTDLNTEEGRIYFLISLLEYSGR